MIETKNIAEQLIYTAEKSLRDAGDKVPAELRKSIEDKVADVKTATGNATPDMEAIKKTTTELSTELQKIAEAMKNGGGTEAPAESSGNNKKEGDTPVRDADFEEKKPENGK